MSAKFKRGGHVEWNSEAGRVRGVVIKKAVTDVRYNGYVHHASKAEPQYFIKSDKSEHIAIHKGSALKRLRSNAPRQEGTAKTARKKIVTAIVRATLIVRAKISGLPIPRPGGSHPSAVPARRSVWT
jgi:hypothetical protein